MQIDPLAYVIAVAPAVGLDLTPERARDVAEALAVVMRVAAPALALDVPAEIEPAPIFRA